MGFDFLLANDANIDLPTRRVRLDGHMHLTSSLEEVAANNVLVLNGVASQPIHKNTFAVLINKERIKILQGTSKIILVPLPHNMQIEKLYLIDPLQENIMLDNIKCYIGRNVCTPIKIKEQIKIPVLMTNMSKEDQIINKGIKLAEITVATNDDIISDETEISHIVSTENKISGKNQTDNINKTDNDASKIIKEKEIENNNIIDDELLNEKLKHLPEKYKIKFKKLFHEYKILFDTKTKPPAPSTIQHKIHTTDDIPVRVRPYRIPKATQADLDENIENKLKSKKIVPSTSPYGAGIVMVKKKTDDNTIKYRATFDFRKLNEKTISEHWPQLIITEAINNLSGCKYFGCIDIKDAFNEIPLFEDHTHKTAFTVPSGKFAGTYEWKYLPFGLKNSGSSFQRFMDGILHGLQPLIVMAYVDDLLIFSNTLDDHYNHFKLVFERLKNANLTINLHKCKIALSEIPYLGYIISNKGIQADPKLVEKIKNAHEPNNKSELQTILGLFNFYRRFIKAYADVVRPMTDLLKDGVEYQFNKNCTNAMQYIQRRLTSCPILIIPDFNKQFILTTDASNYGISAILSQIAPDNLEHPIAYASRRLSTREMAFHTTEREFLAILFGINQFKFYLYQTKFTVITDHKALQYILSMKDPASRILRWQLQLASFDYTVIHRKGTQIPHADALSRYIHVIKTLEITEIQAMQQNDPECIEFSKRKNCKIIDNIIYKNTKFGPKIFVPSALKPIILQQHHDSITALHVGRCKMTKLINENYWWPNLGQDIKLYIQSCAKCAQIKMTDTTKMPLQELPQVDEPFQKIGMDVTELPETDKGYKYILTIVDHLSRYLVMIPLKNQKAATIAKKLNRHFISIYGVPQTILTDQGPNFMSNLFKELCNIYDINKLNTVPYWAQGNGRTEIVHKHIKKYLSYFVDKNQSNWPELLPLIVASYNNLPHKTLNRSPYEIVFLKKMRTPFNVNIKGKKIKDDRIIELAEKLTYIWEETKILSHNAHLKNAIQYDKKSIINQFKVGDLVWLKNERVALHKSKKLTAKYIGPYIIDKIISPVVVKLKITDKKFSVVHKSKLKMYRSRPTDLCRSALAPQISNNEHRVPAHAPEDTGAQRPSTVRSATPTSSSRRIAQQPPLSPQRQRADTSVSRTISPPLTRLRAKTLKISV